MALVDCPGTYCQTVPHLLCKENRLGERLESQVPWSWTSSQPFGGENGPEQPKLVPELNPIDQGYSKSQAANGWLPFVYQSFFA